MLPPSATRLCIAFSGGLDSTVLLHAVHRAVGETHLVRAVHIDHQLQPSSAHWAERCGDVARQLGVPFKTMRVEVKRDEEGLEASARRARYDALKEQLAVDEVLLTAHHVDDQLETMLLALMRGAGVRGLSGVPALQPFGAGWLARPLLNWRRAELHDWAREQGFDWIEDPTNESVSMDRNYLRHRVVPLLSARWPAAAMSAARSAQHLSESSALIDQFAALDLARASIENVLNLDVLRTFDSARRRNVMRFWLRSFGVRAPATNKLASIEHDMLIADRDRTPKVEIDGFELRRHRDRLYCMRKLSPPPAAVVWQRSSELPLPHALGVLRLEPADEGIVLERLPASLEVRFRGGGEVIKLAPNRPHRPLKKVLQDADVLPWWRERLPLIYAGDRLVAVGDSWIEGDFLGRGAGCVSVVWQDKPNIFASR